MASQLAPAATPQRVQLGLVSIQDDLTRIRMKVYVAMSEWDGVSPGALKTVEDVRTAGEHVLERLSKETDS